MDLKNSTSDLGDCLNDRPYLATTQNLSYIPKLARGERAFTILGSGDSVFQLVMCGFSRIAAAEVSPIQIAFFHLRLAAVKALNYKEFTDFLFRPNGKHFLSRDLYKKVRPYLGDCDKESKDALDQFFAQRLFSYASLAIYAINFKGGLEHCDDKTVAGTLTFMKSAKAYQELKRRLSETRITVLREDAMKFLAETNEAYDWIDLSNILLYYCQYVAPFGPECFREAIVGLSNAYENMPSSIATTGGRAAGGAGNETPPRPTMVFDYMFGVSKAELNSGKPQLRKGKTVVEHISLEIYSETLAKLRSVFGKIEVLEARNLASAMPVKGPRDCVIYLQKQP